MSILPARWPASSGHTAFQPISSASALARLPQYADTRTKKSATFQESRPRSKRPRQVNIGPPNADALRDRFANILLEASRCHYHRQRSSAASWALHGTSTSSGPFSSKKHGCSRLRNYSTGTSGERIAESQDYGVSETLQNASKQELMNLMDHYSSESEPATVDTSGRTVGDDSDPAQTRQRNEEHDQEIQRLARHLARLVQNPSTSLDLLAEVYTQLPSPGAAHLSDGVLSALLHRFSRVPHKTQPTMLRFLHLVTDMRAAGRHVPVLAWTSAISFAGRCVKAITSTEIENVLSLWKQMETQAGIRANEVTFNVLFDVASKAGKFVLAEMLLNEMKTRGHKMNRYMRVNLMYYHGLRGDGSGVRRAYKELVEAGEIVDTTVMSCAVAALLKAGEPVAAEQVFERSKRLHAERGGTAPLPPHDWQDRRDLGRSLMHAVVKLRDATPEERKVVHDQAPLAPGVHAYKVLIHYYAVKAGDIDRVSRLVDEMAWYQIPVQGAIFLYLFKGFATHGGMLYSGWTRQRLEMTFQAFLDAVEDARGESSEMALESPQPASQGVTENEPSQQRITPRKPAEKAQSPSRTASEQPTDDGTPCSESAGASQFSFTPNRAPQSHPSDKTHISRAACFLCLSAYTRVVDSTRAGEVWSQLQLMWTPTRSDREAVESYLVELDGSKRKWERYGTRIGGLKMGTMARWLG